MLAFSVVKHCIRTACASEYSSFNIYNWPIFCWSSTVTQSGATLPHLVQLETCPLHDRNPVFWSRPLPFVGDNQQLPLVHYGCSRLYEGKKASEHWISFEYWWTAFASGSRASEIKLVSVVTASRRSSNSSSRIKDRHFKIVECVLNILAQLEVWVTYTEISICND